MSFNILKETLAKCIETDWAGKALLIHSNSGKMSSDIFFENRTISHALFESPRTS